MSILKSIRNWFREMGEEAAVAVADPVRDGKFIIADAEKMIGENRQQIARVLADNKGVQRQLDAALADVAKWQGIAEKADETDKPKAIEKLNAAKRIAIDLKKQLDLNNKGVGKLQEAMQTAEAKVSAAKSNHTQLAARKRSADIRQALAEASNKFGASSSPLAALDALEKQVIQQEDEAEAMEEMTSTTDESLEAKYAVTDTTVDATFDSLFKK